MRNNYNLFTKHNASIKSTMVLLVALSSMIFQNAKAQSDFKIEPNSQIKVAVDSIKNNFTAVASTNSLNAEGNFTIKDGYLEDINSFKMVMPLTKLNSPIAETLGEESLGFNLTHVMVLPTMRLIHIVGILDVGGVGKRTELDFNFVINEDQSISLFGTKSIKLSDYNKEPKYSAASLKENSEIKLNMNLVFKNEQQNLAALSPDK